LVENVYPVGNGHAFMISMATVVCILINLPIRLVQFSTGKISYFEFMRHVGTSVHFDLKRTWAKFFVKKLIFRDCSRASKLFMKMVHIAH